MTPLRVALLVPALCAFSACKDAQVDDHGVVKIELQASGEDPFPGTDTVVIRLDYLECLSEFYTSTHTEWSQTGQSGGPVFEEWAARLCDPDDSKGIAIPECEVESISQNLGGTSTDLSLRVTYKILNPDLNLKVFRFGPMPTEDLTEDCSPSVQLDTGSVRGFNTANEVIWGVESFTAFNKASTGQSGELTVNVAAN